MGFYRLIPDNELTDRQRYVANTETAKYSGKFIKFMGRVNCIEFDYVHRLATRKLFFFCFHGEKMVCVQEDEMDYQFITE